MDRTVGLSFCYLLSSSLELEYFVDAGNFSTYEFNREKIILLEGTLYNTNSIGLTHFATS